MEDMYDKILFSYGLKLYDVQRTRRGLICKTDKGMKELRKTTCDIETISFENRVKKHLYEKGFKDLDLYLETKEGLPYYRGVENNFVLSDFILVQDTNLEDLDMAKKAVEKMADMHKLSWNINGEGKVNFGKLPTIAKKRKSELVKTKKWINGQSRYSDLDMVIIKSYSYFIDRTNRAEEFIRSKSYERATDLAIERKNICHNNFKGENIKKKEKGLHITGFEGCVFDCGVTDLADFLRRQIKENYCDAKMVNQLIDCYNSKLPLEKFELETLGAMILFPAKFFKICNSFYNKRRVLVSEAVLEKLKKSIEISEKEERILKEVELI